MTRDTTCTGRPSQELTPVTNPEEVLATRQDTDWNSNQSTGFALFE